MINSVSNFNVGRYGNNSNCSFAGRDSWVDLDGARVKVTYDSPEFSAYPREAAPKKSNNSNLTPFQKLGLFLGFVATGVGSFAAGKTVATNPKDYDTLNLSSPPGYEANAGSEFYVNTYGCSQDILFAVNGVETEADFRNLSSVKVPHKFDMYDNLLKEKQDKFALLG